jgi:NADH:ubiquinone oxidoreductase subunit F (NADH-binding)
MAGGVLQGASLLGFAPSGPSSGYLPASMIDLPIEWGALSKVGSMVGSAAVVICAEGACMLDMALNAIRFFRNESCGKCVPCRVGTQKMVDMLTAWSLGRFSEDQMPLMNELSETMKSASICGLGQIAPVPVLSVIKHFPEHMEAHLVHKQCPGNICFNR